MPAAKALKGQMFLFTKMVDLRKCEDEKSKQHWAFVEATSNIVRRWPRWKVAAALTAQVENRQNQVENLLVWAIRQSYSL